MPAGLLEEEMERRLTPPSRPGSRRPLAEMPLPPSSPTQRILRPSVQQAPVSTASLLEVPLKGSAFLTVFRSDGCKRDLPFPALMLTWRYHLYPQTAEAHWSCLQLMSLLCNSWVARQNSPLNSVRLAGQISSQFVLVSQGRAMYAVLGSPKTSSRAKCSCSYALDQHAADERCQLEKLHLEYLGSPDEPRPPIPYVPCDTLGTYC
jgi:hypothetical protein